MGISPEKRQYFDFEAEAARTPGHRKHLNPSYPPGAHVVDVGCGGGWEGEAGSAARFVGVDIDEDVLEYRLARNSKTEFRLGSAEALPFADGEFTFYSARVSLIYTDLAVTFKEAHRVLADGGTVWITGQDFRYLLKCLGRSVLAGAWRDVIFRGYVILNGFLFHATGRVVRFPLNRARIESMQTRRGLRIALERAGFSDVEFPPTEHGELLVMARKRATGTR